VISFFGWNIIRLQAVVHCFSRHYQFGRAKKGVTKLQASSRRVHLVFLIGDEKEMRDTLLKVFRAQKAHKVERHKLKLFSRLYESVRNNYLM
jgi:hypothetical protein